MSRIIQIIYVNRNRGVSAVYSSYILLVLIHSKPALGLYHSKYGNKLHVGELWFIQLYSILEYKTGQADSNPSPENTPCFLCL